VALRLPLPSGPRPRRLNFDTADFVAGCRKLGCTPHVSQNASNRRSAIDARTTRHPGYRTSTKTDRRTVRLDEDRRGPAQDAASWSRFGGMVLRPGCGRLQSNSNTEDPGSNGVSPTGSVKDEAK
jgi:hypothetical protein